VIDLDWKSFDRDIGDVAAAFKKLPPHIGRKHMLAAMRRSVTKSRAVSMLRQNTPPVGTRRGRRKKGEKKRSTGELRRSATSVAKWIGRSGDGVAVAGVGYRFGFASRKAIWQEFGTSRMNAVGMMARTFEQFRSTVASFLAGEMADALEKAANEVASGKNKGYGG